jgi:hypothetical protein
LKAQFTEEDGTYEAVPAQLAVKQAFTRDQLILVSGWLTDEPKLTLKEIRAKLVEEDEYDNLSNVPDTSTLWRQMKKMGFKWQRPKYSDPRAKRDVIKWERCEFRRNQDSDALDPTTLVSIDETNWYYEQATRAWGTTASPATLEKPKGKVMRRSMIASIGFSKVGDEYKAFIHWVFIPPRRSWAPLPDTIQEYEIGAEEKADIKDSLSTQVINKLSTVGLKGAWNPRTCK